MTEPDEAPGKTVLPGTVFAGGTTPDTAPPAAGGPLMAPALVIPVLPGGVVERWLARQRGNGIGPVPRLTRLMAEDLGDSV